MAKRILSNHATALDTLTREELGMSAGEAGNAWVAAVTSFTTFSAGAIVPVLPWLAVGGTTGLVLSAVLSGLGLFGTGAITTLFTGRSVVFSGSRMAIFGFVGAVISYAAGGLVGAGAGV